MGFTSHLSDRRRGVQMGRVVAVPSRSLDPLDARIPPAQAIGAQVLALDSAQEALRAINAVRRDVAEAELRRRAAERAAKEPPMHDPDGPTLRVVIVALAAAAAIVLFYRRK